MNAVLAEAPAAPQHLSIRFIGSGSEYFRIWIVNLLLTLVTLGIYFPWAKVRRLRYFYGNTLIGDSPLAFHGNPMLMLRGYAVMAVVFVAYGIVSHLSPLAGLLALALLAVVWPALWRASMQFRLANTSWRGMRFVFDGSLGEAYKALLPLWVPALLLGFGGLMAQPHEAGEPAAPSPWVGLMLLAAMLFLPVVLFWVKRYQHAHYVYGREQSTLELGWKPFYGLCLKAFGLMIAIMLVFGVAGGAMVYSLHVATTGQVASAWLSLLPLLLIMLGYLVMIVCIGPFFTARLQNLLWTATRTRHIRVESGLRARELTGLTLKIWLLMPLTLGFYWPFARIALARLRLAAVTVDVDGGVDALAGGGALQRPGAAGDAAGEFFGIDLGL